MKNYTFLIAISLLLACNSRTGNNSKYIISSGGTHKDQEHDQGNDLFQKNCASCHNMMKESTGPALNKQLIQDRSDHWMLALMTDQKRLQKDSAYKARVKIYGFSCPETPMSKEKLQVLVSYIRNPSSCSIRE